MFYDRGVALERAGQWPRAEGDLLHALDLKADQPLVLNYLGYSWVDRGENLDRGLKMIEKAVELRPEDGYIVDSLGWAHYRLGEYEKAAEYLEKATELVPEDPTINDHLGDAYWQTGRLVEARYQWRRAVQFGPQSLFKRFGFVQDLPVVRTSLLLGQFIILRFDGRADGYSLQVELCFFPICFGAVDQLVMSLPGDGLIGF